MAAEFGKTFLVEPLEERLSSPALIYFISKDGNLQYIGGSEQVLSEGLVYSGTRFPMGLKKHNNQDLLDLGNKIADKIRDIGFIGPFNIDFIETSDGIYPVECNARFCASLYTAMLNQIMRKRHGDYEHSLTLSYTGLSGIRNFRQLQERVGSMLYDGTNVDCKVIPINVGHLKHGRVVVVFTSKSEADLTDVQNTFGNYVNIRR